MSKYQKFEDFERAVINNVKHKTNQGRIGAVCGAALGYMIGGPIGAVARAYVPAIGSVVGLNEHMYKSYIKEVYKQRFEAHKNDDKYISDLINEASDRMINLYM